VITIRDKLLYDSKPIVTKNRVLYQHDDNKPTDKTLLNHMSPSPSTTAMCEITKQCETIAT